MNKKIIMVGNTLTAVVNGNTYTLTTATVEDYHNIMAAETEEAIKRIVQPEIYQKEKAVKDEKDRVDTIRSGYQNLIDSGKFFEENGAVYMTGTERSIPQILVTEFSNAFGQDDSTRFESLRRFWLKCMLNPNAKSANDLFRFLEKHNMKITQNGNFLAYRRVVSKESDNKKLVEFVANQYTKLRARRKATGAFDVWENYITKEPMLVFAGNAPSDTNNTYEFKGNLKELYLNIDTLQTVGYTDNHTHTFDYRIGEIASIPRDQGDDNNQISCSKGLHSASKAYDYSGFGDTDILVIISPNQVLAVPQNEDGKLRTSAFYFACTLSYDERYILDQEDFDVTELDDLFEKKLMFNLEEEVKKGFTEEVKRHSFALPKITAAEITNICYDLKGIVADRVTKIANTLHDEDEYSDYDDSYDDWGY